MEKLNRQKRRQPTVPRKARGGIQARSKTGEFAIHWWARRWIQAMEYIVDAARLQRGQRYARMGQVLSIEENDTGVVARVQGSRSQPYRVNFRLQPLTDEQWGKVLDILSARAMFAAQLLVGEMPSNIEEAFSAAGVSLFPVRGGDLVTDCSCPDWANPCKHIAATHYILGDRFDEDPFLLFRLRGRTQDQIMESLRHRRTAQAEDQNIHPEDETPEIEEISADENTFSLGELQSVHQFWGEIEKLEDFTVSVKPPAIDLPILKRLGEPDFASHEPLKVLLGDAYQTISQAALFIAFHGLDIEAPPAEDNNNQKTNGNGKE